MNKHNPYQTPNSDLTTLNDFNRLSIRHAFGWMKLAWELFWQKPFMWMVSTFVFWVILALSAIMTASILPTLVMLVQSYFLFVYYGSVIFVAKAQYDKRTVDMVDGMVFISDNLKRLTLLFIIVAVICALYGLLFWLIITGAMMVFVHLSNYEHVYFYLNTDWSSWSLHNLLNNYLVLLIYWVIFLPVIMATIFMSMLVILDNHKITPALKLSFKSYAKNIAPLTVYALVQFMLSFVLLYVISHYSALFLFLLLLVFFPMSLIGIVIAYFNIFHIHPFNHLLNQQHIPSDI